MFDQKIIDYALLSDYVYSRHEEDQPFDPETLGFSNIKFNSNESSENLNAVDHQASGFYEETWEYDGKVIIAFRGTNFAEFINDLPFSFKKRMLT